MPDFSAMKLGKRFPKIQSNRLMLANYLPPELPDPPESVNYTFGVTNWGALLNNQLGCCTISGVGHAIQAWRLSLGAPLLDIPDSIIENYYSKWDGYVPGDSSTDRGGIEVDVLNQWRKEGFIINGVGHMLKGYVDPSPRNLKHIHQSIYLFGNVYIGVALPISAQGQTTWDLEPGYEGEPGTWGGHCVIAVSYRPGFIGFISWGNYMEMTERFWLACCDESHTLLSDTDWRNPHGVKYEALLSDLSKVAA